LAGAAKAVFSKPVTVTKARKRGAKIKRIAAF
jgi:hypothetical protein